MLHMVMGFDGVVDADAGPGELLLGEVGARNFMLQRLRPGDGGW